MMETNLLSKVKHYQTATQQLLNQYNRKFTSAQQIFEQVFWVTDFNIVPKVMQIEMPTILETRWLLVMQCPCNLCSGSFLKLTF